MLTCLRTHDGYHAQESVKYIVLSRHTRHNRTTFGTCLHLIQQEIIKKLRRNHFCFEEDSLWISSRDEKKAKASSYSISNRSKSRNGMELFEPLYKHSDSSQTMSIASTDHKMGHLWSLLTALTANWELHIWHPWDTMASTACSFDVQNPDPSCPSKWGKCPAIKLGGWDVDLWCLSSSPRWTAFLQSVSFSSCSS